MKSKTRSSLLVPGLGALEIDEGCLRKSGEHMQMRLAETGVKKPLLFPVTDR